MNNALVRYAGAVRLGIVAAVLFTLMATRVAASPSGVLDACVNPGNGMMRLVESSSACHNNETFVEWNVTGPQGPAGPQGPQGPPGAAAGGPPFVWVCAPAFAPGGATLGNNDPQYLYVFNGGASDAKIAVHIFDKDGNNLAGVNIPGATTAPFKYPGQTGTDTVTVASMHTLIDTWQLPNDSPPGGPNVSVSVQVISDQPIFVGNGFAGTSTPACGLLPK